MNRKIFLKAMLAAMASAPFISYAKQNSKNRSQKDSIRLIRHATLSIKLQDLKILVDPMLGVRESMDPVQNAENQRRIPMVSLPLKEEEIDKLIRETNIVIVTHLHRDHWDRKAIETIDKHKLILCQPGDIETIRKQGFVNVESFDKFSLGKITIERTSGKHGTGEIGKLMGKVSGVVIKSTQMVVYIAGDTIWCDEVKQAIEQYKPDYIIVNAGAAQFLTGGPITMTKEDVKSTLQFSEKSKVMAVHMDTVNHCLLTRKELGTFLSEEVSSGRLLIPNDGEIVEIR
jgi:L-ascorbate metabolism protein UlaG (beta-lactamase superfamily)